MYTLEHVSLTYPSPDGAGFRALSDLNLTVTPHDRWVIIGPSGSGKTTLLLLLAGLLKPTSGQILFNGNPLQGPQPEVSLILQDYGLFPWKTVLENAALGLILRKTPKKQWRDRVLEVLEQLGLSGVKDKYPSQLSGGQRQRVALARALAVRPQFLLMDEPLSALDALTREKLQDKLLELWYTLKFTMILVTHSIEEAAFLGNRIVFLSSSPGRIACITENASAGIVERSSDTYCRQCLVLRSLLERGKTLAS